MNYSRRKTTTVTIGDVKLGSDYPIRLQSMTSTSTMDTEGSIAQCKRICDNGADIVRLTAQGVREAENIGVIRKSLHESGYTTPLVADIHFKWNFHFIQHFSCFFKNREVACASHYNTYYRFHILLF